MAEPPLSDTDLPVESAGLFSLLPLVYVAWADGNLSPAELREIKDRLQAEGWIQDEDKAVLADWLDPEHPPSATEYLRWLRMIRAAARRVPEASRKSLADLGIEMALAVTPSGDLTYAKPEARRALRDIEAALGIVGEEATRELLEDRPLTPEVEVAEPAFEVEAMKALLDGPHAALRDRVRRLLSDPAFAYVDPDDVNIAAYRDQVLAWAKRLADEGLGALSFPKAYGGEGNIEQFIVAFETLAYHDLSLVIKFGVQFGLFGGSVHQLGTEYHHKTYLPAIGRLDLPGCFAMSELGHGSNVRELETKARFDRETDHFIIHTPNETSRKEWIGNAARHGQLATVFAQLQIDDQSYGVHAFLVPIRNEDGTVCDGVRIEDCGEKMGLNGVDNGRIWFDHVHIPRRNLLNRFADVTQDGFYQSPIPSEGRRFFTMLSTLVGGRISIAKSGLSATKSALTIAIRYGERRRQFGPKGQAEVRLLDYLTHQRRLFPPLAQAYALHVALEDLNHKFAKRDKSEEEIREIESLAAGLKAYGTWLTTHTIQTCREACGGQGYLEVNRFAALKADTDIFATFEGDNTVLMLQVAKGLLSDLRQAFENMNLFFGLLKYASETATTAVREMNPITTRLTDESHLRSPDFHQSAFQYREDRLLRTAGARIRDRIKSGMDSYLAFVEVQDHLVALSNAHIERVLYDRFRTAVDETEDEALKTMLGTLCDLFALERLEADRGWFLEQGYFEGGKAKAIRRLVNRLLTEIRPQAIHLVDAFAIPDACLAAPIGLETGWQLGG